MELEEMEEIEELGDENEDERDPGIRKLSDVQMRQARVDWEPEELIHQISGFELEELEEL